MSERSHHRPQVPGAAYFEAIANGTDPVQIREAADRVATLLVRGARASDDVEVADRVLHLADTEGLETLAELWSGAPADTLAGSLWRLYVLRAWVHADPVGAARQFEAGHTQAQVDHLVAGVADPPDADALRAMVDQALRGVVVSDFADVLLRAAAFVRVVAAGRAALELPVQEMTRMLTLAEQLEHAARLELADPLP